MTERSAQDGNPAQPALSGAMSNQPRCERYRQNTVHPSHPIESGPACPGVLLDEVARARNSRLAAEARALLHAHLERKTA